MATANVKKEIGTIILVSLLFIAFAFYISISIFWSLSTSEARNMVHDATENAANVVHNRVESRLAFITTLSSLPFMRPEKTPMAEKIAAFEGVSALHGLTSLGLATANGLYLNSNGARYDISFREDFQEAMGGKSVVSTAPSSGEFAHRPTICYMVPLYNEKKEQYGIFGAQDEGTSLAQLLFDLNPFKGKGQHLLLTDRGTFLDQKSPQIAQDFYAFLQSGNKPEVVEDIRRSLRQENHAQSHVLIDGTRYCLGICQVKGTPSLYAVTLVPDTVSHYQGTVAYIFIVIVFMVLACSILGVGRYVLKLRRKSQSSDTLISVATAQLGYYTIVFDNEKKVTACSDNFSKTFLHPGDSAVGMDCYALIADYNEDIMAKMDSESGTFETQITTVENVVVPVQWLLIPNFVTNTNTLFGFDLTPKLEKQKAQAALSKAQIMQNIFDCVPIPVALKDLDERVIMANTAYATMVRSTTSGVIGRSPAEIFPGGAMDDISRIFHKSIAKKEPGSIIKNLPDPNKPDASLCYRCNQVPMLDENGVVNSVLAVSIDISDSMRSQEQLAREVGRLQSLFNQSPVGVIVVVEEKVCFINARAREMTSVTMEDNVWESLHCLDKKSNILDDLARYGTAYNFEISTRNHQGIGREIIATAATTRYNEFPAVVVWTIDVTPLKEIERSLIEAREAAEAATQAKSDFLARMSHEIRTPMNAILGMVFLSLQTKLAPDQKNYLQKAHSAATNLLSIINDILDFSKIEANKMEMERIPFTLSSVVKDIVDLTYQLADKKGLELLFHIDPSIPNALLGDPLRLKQVLINLVSNAIKFTTSGDVLVRAALDHFDGSTAHIIMTVADSGIGMSEEDMSRLFVPFAQVDGSITRKYGGSGLGLVISESIVKALGGTISVSSKRNVGTTFTCRLPIECESGLLHEPLAQRQNLACHILVVDDNSTAREILREILLGTGSTVDIAKSSFEALNMVEQSVTNHAPYELIFMDWVMPHMDGVLCAEKVLEICKYSARQPLICMMTGYSLESLRNKAQAIGVHHCLVKPLTSESVYNFLETHFSDILSVGESRKVESGPQKLLPLTRKNVRLLLVEDNEDNIEVATVLLTRMGCQVSVARNGLEGVEMAEAHYFDCILMDMQMPYMDGLEATRAIRALPQDYTRTVPILCMSANALQAHKEKAFAAGMDGYIVKPFDPFVLRDTLEERLQPLNRGEKLEAEAVALSRAAHGATGANTKAPGRPTEGPTTVDSAEGPRTVDKTDNTASPANADDADSADKAISADKAAHAPHAAHTPRAAHAAHAPHIEDTEPQDATLQSPEAAPATERAGRQPSALAGRACAANGADSAPDAEPHAADCRGLDRASGDDSGPASGNASGDDSGLRSEPDSGPASGAISGADSGGIPTFGPGPADAASAAGEAEDRSPQQKEPTADSLCRPNMEDREDTEAPEVPEVSLPDSLPGFELMAGLHNVGNDVPAYLEHLRLFSQRYATVSETLTEALQVQDSQEAMRLTHTIKGVAATFGAKNLSRSAAAVESALREAKPGQTDISPSGALAPLLEEFHTRLAEALGSSASLQRKPESAEPLAPGQSISTSSRAEIVDMLGVLQEVSGSDLLGAATLIEKLQPLLKANGLGSSYTDLYTALRNCDMEALNTAITKALAALHI